MTQQTLFQISGVDQVIPVKGLEGAKSYPMGSNCRTPLFDDSENYFYIKQTDENGFPTIRTFKFEEIIEDNNNGGVSVDQIRSIIKEELMSVKEELLNAQQFVSESRNNSADKSDGAANAANAASAKYHAAANKPTKQQPKQNSSIVANGEE